MKWPKEFWEVNDNIIVEKLSLVEVKKDNDHAFYNYGESRKMEKGTVTRDRWSFKLDLSIGMAFITEKEAHLQVIQNAEGAIVISKAALEKL